MKKLAYLYKLLFALSVTVIIFSCDGDDDDPSTADIDFLTIASSYDEANGTGTLTIPLRGSADPNAYSFEFDGTATEGEDYEVIGVTGEGFQVSIIDDNNLEQNESIRVRMVSPNLNLNGNAIHTITIVSNCEDSENPFAAHFVGNYNAIEKYGPGPGPPDWYGPYEITLVQDETDPNMFHFDNLYDNGCDAYMVFDFAAGTVHFPDQEPCGVPLTNSSGTFSLDACQTELTINLNFDGGDWVYSFTKL